MISRSQNETIRLARAHLSRAADTHRAALIALVAEVGAVEASSRVLSGDVAFAVSEKPVCGAEVLARQDLELAESLGGRLVIPEDDEWPAQQFAALSGVRHADLEAGAPLALWVLGPHKLSEVLHEAVAITGSRAASGYGEHVAAEFGYGLAERGVAVVSGGAYGIDGAAHRSALHAKGVTIAVLPCGVGVAYPAGHQGLLGAIATKGVVISEHPPMAAPARHRFLARNRILAALGAGTVVVESGRRSGAKNVAAAAVAMGRVLMAVPGPITAATSVGSHELMRSGLAVPVSSVAEIVDSVQSLSVGAAGELGGVHSSQG